jgi:hypothetical protein
MQTDTPGDDTTDDPVGNPSSREDWAAVALAITQRMGVLGWGLSDLVRHSRLSCETVRQIQLNVSERRRYANTLRALSVALGWHTDHLTAILHGQTPPPPAEHDRPQAVEPSADHVGNNNRTSRLMPIFAFCTIYPDVSITPCLDQYEAMVGLRFGTFETTQLRLDFFQTSDLLRLRRAVDVAIQLLRVRSTYRDPPESPERIDHQ